MVYTEREGKEERKEGRKEGENGGEDKIRIASPTLENPFSREIARGWYRERQLWLRVYHPLKGPARHILAPIATGLFIRSINPSYPSRRVLE